MAVAKVAAEAARMEVEMAEVAREGVGMEPDSVGKAGTWEVPVTMVVESAAVSSGALTAVERR